MKRTHTCCHSREGGNPGNAENWIPHQVRNDKRNQYITHHNIRIAMKGLFNIILLTVLLLAPFSSQVEAHRLQPAYLEISEQSAGKFSILWKRPLVGSRPMNIYPQLPSSCANLTEPVMQPLASGAIERWLVDCGSSGMINETIIIDGLPATQTDTLLRIQLINGSMHTTVLRPDSPSFLVPQ